MLGCLVYVMVTPASALAQPGNGRDLYRALIAEGNRFAQDLISLEITTKFHSGRTETRREEYSFANTDSQGKGTLQFAVRVLIPNPGEPHLPDDWIMKEMTRWDGKEKTFFKRTMVHVPPIKPRLSEAEISGYSIGQLTTCDFSAMYVGDGLHSMQNRLGAYVSDRMNNFQFSANGRAELLGQDCVVIDYGSKDADPVSRHYITATPPHVLLKVVGTKPEEFIAFEVTKLDETADGYAPGRGYRIPIEGYPGYKPHSNDYPVRHDFRLLECRPAAPTGEDRWMSVLPTGTAVRRHGTTRKETIPFTPAEINAIRKAASAVQSHGFWEGGWISGRLILNISLVVIIGLLGFTAWRRT